MPQVEFLSLRRVIEACGISKSEIYRKIRLGSFPKSYPYRDSPTRRFWLSTEIASWQQSQVEGQADGGDFDGLL